MYPYTVMAPIFLLYMPSYGWDAKLQYHTGQIGEIDYLDGKGFQKIIDRFDRSQVMDDKYVPM